MSLLTEIQRIRNSKAAIKAAIEQKGVTVPDSARINDYPSYVSLIPGHDIYTPGLIERTATSYTFPESIVNSGNISLRGWTTLQHLNTCNGNTLGETALSGCTGLTTLVAPKLTYIGSNAFWECTALRSFTLYTVTPPTLVDGSLNYLNNCTFYVPAEAVNTYKWASGWSGYANRILPIPES